MRKPISITALILCFLILGAYITLAATAPPPTGSEWTSETFWKIISAVSAVAMISLGYSIRQKDKNDDKRDALLEKIATIVFGDESGKGGLTTRVTVMENNIDRCEGCSPKQHYREGDIEPHTHLRHNNGVRS